MIISIISLILSFLGMIYFYRVGLRITPRLMSYGRMVPAFICVVLLCLLFGAALIFDRQIAPALGVLCFSLMGFAVGVDTRSEEL